MTERRRDPLTGEWRIFADHRQERTFLPPDEQCPLCPTRSGGPETEVPEAAYDIVVFDNRFPSMTHAPPAPSVADSPLCRVEPAFGACEVVVYTDRHTASLADLSDEQLTRIVDVWADRYAELRSRAEVAYVFVFENRGEAAGVTLNHPHGQVYGYPEVPPVARAELETAIAYRADHGTCVVCDIVEHEAADGSRLVSGDEAVVAYVPFAARFPYEVHVSMREHLPSLLDVDDDGRRALAQALGLVVRAYDALFDFPLSYVMSVHQEPTDGGDWRAVSHLHVEFAPFHRTAEKLKYLAGSELGAGVFLNDTNPEETAARLRAAVHRSEFSRSDA